MHRVMLVLTFAPKPRLWAETRQATQGLSYSMNWSVFGSTTWDFGRIWYPQRILKSLGLKRGGGINLVDLSLQRLANGDGDGSMNSESYQVFVEMGVSGGGPSFSWKNMTPKTVTGRITWYPQWWCVGISHQGGWSGGHCVRFTGSPLPTTSKPRKSLSPGIVGCRLGDTRDH
jgi:hypothetical protein